MADPPAPKLLAVEAPDPSSENLTWAPLGSDRRPSAAATAEAAGTADAEGPPPPLAPLSSMGDVAVVVVRCEAAVAATAAAAAECSEQQWKSHSVINVGDPRYRRNIV